MGERRHPRKCRSRRLRIRAKNQKKNGRLEGRTTSAGSSARLDGSQGKLRAEKPEKRKKQVSPRANNLPVHCGRRAGSDETAATGDEIQRHGGLRCAMH